MPYVGLKVWNSFINVTSTLDLLDASLLLYWKLGKFKKFVKDTFLHFQSLNSDVTWDSLNLNLLELEASDDGRKNSSESSCYAYIYCYFYVFTQLYKSLKY